MPIVDMRNANFTPRFEAGVVKELQPSDRGRNDKHPDRKFYVWDKAGTAASE